VAVRNDVVIHVTKGRRLSHGVILSSAVGPIQIFKARCLSRDEGSIKNLLCGCGHGHCAHDCSVRIVVRPAAGPAQRYGWVVDNHDEHEPGAIQTRGGAEALSVRAVMPPACATSSRKSARAFRVGPRWS
jgi:hypothetical protein